MWKWIANIAWRALLKRVLPYALAAVMAAWALSIWWAYDQGQKQGVAAQERAWAAAYAQAVRGWHSINKDLAALNVETAHQIEVARQDKRIVVKEVVRYVERVREQQPELAVCVFDDSFMQLRRAQLARTRSAAAD